MKLLILIITLSHGLSAQVIKTPEYDLIAFGYHDVGPDVLGKLHHDSNAINTQYLAHHFQWLKDNGYTVVSNQAIELAQAGLLQLPPKAVSLSFDDGYQSVYYQVFPLLKAYNYPATIGIVTSWIENQASPNHQFEVKFMSWEQIKELAESPLIEIASHSHDLHHGITANPQGSTQPAATSRKYDSVLGYENDGTYHDRIKTDLKQSKDLIYAHTNKYPTTLIWPYGSYSKKAWEIAKTIGFTSSMTLDQGHNNTSKNDHISRYLINENPATHEFKQFFSKSSYQTPRRVVHIDLDYVFDQDPNQQERNLDQLLERIKKLSINTVFLQAFADPDGDGNADALYFNNPVMPVRADLFNRVAWQLRTRSHVNVYAWMPVSAFILPDNIGHEWQVQSWQKNHIHNSQENYKRLSIFHPQAQNSIIGIYAALAKYNNFAGILFHDDGLLTNHEDLSPHAIQYYKDHGLKFNQAAELINNPGFAVQWSRMKTLALIEFTHRLAEEVRRYRPRIKTARNLYARPVLNPDSEQWFAQNLELFTENYDLTAIMAMPFLEKAKSSSQWLRQLITAVKSSNINKTKLLFELQAKDWSSNQAVPTKTLIQQMAQLVKAGFPQYGYYPDDFLNDHPNLAKILPHMSLNDFPHEKK